MNKVGPPTGNPNLALAQPVTPGIRTHCRCWNARGFLALWTAIPLSLAPTWAGEPAPPLTPPSPNQDAPAFYEKIKELPPAERQAALRAWSEQRLKQLRTAGRTLPQPEPSEPLPAEVSEARRQSALQSFEARRGELQSRKAAGTITPLEEAQLEKLDHLLGLQRRRLSPSPPRTNAPPITPPSAALAPSSTRDTAPPPKP